MIEIVYDGLATLNLNSEGCACCLCKPNSAASGSATAEYSGAVTVP
jgi:hypothetical protein